MQFEVVLKYVGVWRSREYYIRDRRGSAPSYRAFDLVSRDEAHTIAPNRKMALEVAKAYLDYAAKYPSFALSGKVVTRAYR